MIHITTWETRDVGKDVEKGGRSAFLVGIQTGTAPGENSVEVPQKVKNRTTSNGTTRYLPK